jgi:hypothetical protein
VNADGDDSIDAQLKRSSSQFAQSALAALHDDDDMRFAVNAAIATEHAFKALLASRHPALVAAQDFDSLLHACRQAAGSRIPRYRMRTITARESLTRVGQLLPAIKNLESQLAPLFEARNSAAHLGEAASTHELRVPFIRAIEHVRTDLGMPPASFWGDYEGVVDAALDEQARDAALRVESALAAARGEFARRYGHLDKAARDTVIDVIEAGYRPEKYEQMLVDCPACSRGALASGATEVDWEPEGEGDAGFIATFTPGYLHCRVCGP